MSIKQENSLAQQISSFPQQLEGAERSKYDEERGFGFKQESDARANLMNANADLVRAKIKSGNLGGGAGGTNAMNATVPVGEFKGMPWRNLPSTARFQALADTFADKHGAYDPDTDTVDTSKFTGPALQQYNQLLMAGNKTTTNAYTQKRLQQASNVMTTLDKLDMTPIAYYSGTKGKARLANDKALAAMGNAPEMFNRYQVTTTMLSGAVDQLTQYWGASITQPAIEAKEKMFNNGAWTNNPQTVFNTYNQMKNLVNAEKQTNVAAATDPNFIYGAAPTAPPAGQGDQLFSEQSSTQNFQQESPLAPAPGSSPSKGSVTGGSTGNTYTTQDIQDIAKKYNKTVPQTIQILMEQG